MGHNEKYFRRAFPAIRYDPAHFPDPAGVKWRR